MASLEDTQRRMIRLLVNDVDSTAAVFTDADLDDFLALERGAGKALVKRAAALAIETNADNEALASKVLTDRDLTTDGAKLQAALLARAKLLRAQADVDEADVDDAAEADVFFTVGPTLPGCDRGPELVGWY